MAKRWLVGGVLAALVAVAAGLWVYERPRSEPTTVAIGTFSIAIDYTPYLVAKQKGWFAEALAKDHAKPTFTRFETLPAINESLGTGRLDVIFEAEPPVIIARAAGIDVRVTEIGCTLPVDVLVAPDSPIKSFADLKGKTIAVLSGTSSQYGVLKNALASGLKDKDLTFRDMAPPDAKGAFETRQVDAWAVWPPWVEQEIVAGKGRTLTGGDANIQSIMALRGGFVDKHPELAKDINDTMARAKAWVQAHPEEAQAIVAKEAKLDPKVVQLAWPKHHWNVSFTPEVVTDIQQKADFLEQKGLIRTHVDVAKDLIRR